MVRIAGEINMFSYDDSKQMTLGQLIKALEKIEDKNKEVYFDFGYHKPLEFDSWRGSYDLLSLSYLDYEDVNYGEKVTVQDLLDKARNVTSNTFQGYKGGDYQYDDCSSIWVAEYGNSGWTGLSGVLDTRHKVILQTCYVEY